MKKNKRDAGGLLCKLFGHSMSCIKGRHFPDKKEKGVIHLFFSYKCDRCNYVEKKHLRWTDNGLVEQNND